MSEAHTDEAKMEQMKHSLTNREKQILDLAAQGDTNRVIAEKLGISLPTVKNHCAYIYLKLDVINRVQAVMKVYASREVQV